MKKTLSLVCIAWMPSEGEEGGRKWAGGKGRDPTLWALWTTSKDNAKGNRKSLAVFELRRDSIRFASEYLSG